MVKRGVDYTLNHMTAILRRYNLKYGRDGWVLKCDIHHYFESIRHDVAKKAVAKRVYDKDMQQKVFDIIDSFGGDTGIGLGSQVSQLVALAVLDDLDHFIKEVLHVKHYIRYMDDFILIHPDKEYLQYCRKEIEKKLTEIGLELNDKTILHPLKQGVKLLQWKFYITDSGRILRLMNKTKVSKTKRKLRKIYAKELSGEYEPGTTKRSLGSFIANADRGDTNREQRLMLNYYKHLTSIQNGS